MPFISILDKVEKKRNKLSELSYLAVQKKEGFYQEPEAFGLSVDNDQHNEIYPDPYYNYLPIYLDSEKQTLKERMRASRILSVPDNTLQKVQ